MSPDSCGKYILPETATTTSKYFPKWDEPHYAGQERCNAETHDRG